MNHRNLGGKSVVRIPTRTPVIVPERMIEKMNKVWLLKKVKRLYSQVPHVAGHGLKKLRDNTPKTWSIVFRAGHCTAFAIEAQSV